MVVYEQVLAQNIRAARSRRGLGQALIAARMRALGHQSWHPQTVSATEKATRRVTAEEVFGLAYALEASVASLMTPAEEDVTVAFPSGVTVSVTSAHRSVRAALNDGELLWKDATPVPASGHEPIKPSFPPDDSHMMRLDASTARYIADLQDRLAKLEAAS